MHKKKLKKCLSVGLNILIKNFNRMAYPMVKCADCKQYKNINNCILYGKEIAQCMDCYRAKTGQNAGQHQPSNTPQPRLGRCRVKECTKCNPWDTHFCKYCRDKDSDHFSRDCYLINGGGSSVQIPQNDTTTCGKCKNIRYCGLGSGGGWFDKNGCSNTQRSGEWWCGPCVTQIPNQGVSRSSSNNVQLCGVVFQQARAPVPVRLCNIYGCNSVASSNVKYCDNHRCTLNCGFCKVGSQHDCDNCHAKNSHRTANCPYKNRVVVVNVPQVQQQIYCIPNCPACGVRVDYRQCYVCRSM